MVVQPAARFQIDRVKNGANGGALPGAMLVVPVGAVGQRGPAAPPRRDADGDILDPRAEYRDERAADRVTGDDRMDWGLDVGPAGDCEGSRVREDLERADVPIDEVGLPEGKAFRGAAGRTGGKLKIVH